MLYLVVFSAVSAQPTGAALKPSVDAEVRTLFNPRGVAPLSTASEDCDECDDSPLGGLFGGSEMPLTPPYTWYSPYCLSDSGDMSLWVIQSLRPGPPWNVDVDIQARERDPLATCDAFGQDTSIYGGLNVDYVIYDFHPGGIPLNLGGADAGFWYFWGNFFNVSIWTSNQTWYSTSGSLLGIEAGFTAPAGWPAEVWDVGILTAGVPYVILCYSEGMPNPALDLFQNVHSPGPPNNAYDYQNRNDELSGRNLFPATDGESIILTPTQTGYYADVVGAINATGGDFAAGWYQYYPLSPETPVATPRGGFMNWNQTLPNWASIAVKADAASWRGMFVMETHAPPPDSLWWPYIFSASRDTLGPGRTEFCVSDHGVGGAPLGNWYAKERWYGGNVSYTEWSDGVTLLTGPGTWPTPVTYYPWANSQVAWTWDLAPTGCPNDQYEISLLQNIGSSLDLGFAIFDPVNGTYQGRDQAIALVDAAPAGGNEGPYTLTATAVSPYALTVFGNNFLSGEFQVLIECPTYGDAEEGGKPTAFAFRAEGAGSRNARFTLQLPVGGAVTLSLFDVTGRFVGKPIDGNLSAASHTVSWRAPARGVYFYSLSLAGREMTGKFVVR